MDAIYAHTLTNYYDAPAATFSGKKAAQSIRGALKALFTSKTDTPIDWNALQQDSPRQILQLFNAAFHETSCKFEKDRKPYSAPAALETFRYTPPEGERSFNNVILLDKKNANRDKLKISSIHEKVHAIQWSKNPVLHASPYNRMTNEDVPVLLTPRSWLMMTILTERDAYAKTAWLAATDLSIKPSEGLSAAMRFQTVTINDVQHWSARFPDDIAFALGEAALCWDNRIMNSGNKSTAPVTLYDHYIEQALSSLERIKRFEPDNQSMDLVFVDLDDQDILNLGSSFGPSIFGKTAPDPMFKSLKLKPEYEDRLAALNTRLGIDPNAQYPNLSEALKPFNLTAAGFMAKSKSYVYAPKGHGPAQQLKAEDAQQITLA